MIQLKEAIWTVISAATMLVLWWLGNLFYPQTIPGIAETTDSLVVILTDLGPYNNPWYYHVYLTAEMIVLSLALSLVAGTVIGVALGTSETLEEAVSSWVYAWLAIPSLVLVFLSGIWFGFDVWAGFFAVPIVITPFVTLNMWEGARNLDDDLDELATFLGVSRYQRFRDVTLPQLVPYLFASIRSGLSIGWKITLLVEAFLLTRGVGFMFKFYFDQYNLAQMIAWLLVFIALLVIVEYGMVVPLRSRLTHWRPETSDLRAAE